MEIIPHARQNLTLANTDQSNPHDDSFWVHDQMHSACAWMMLQQWDWPFTSKTRVHWGEAHFEGACDQHVKAA